jgi:hypothetical protein
MYYFSKKKFRRLYQKENIWEGVAEAMTGLGEIWWRMQA